MRKRNKPKPELLEGSAEVMQLIENERQYNLVAGMPDGRHCARFNGQVDLSVWHIEPPKELAHVAYFDRQYHGFKKRQRTHN